MRLGHGAAEQAVQALQRRGPRSLRQERRGAAVEAAAGDGARRRGDLNLDRRARLHNPSVRVP